MFILCRNHERKCATTSERKCAAIFLGVAASRNNSMFFNERAAASEKLSTTASERKMCSCFLELCPLKKYLD